MNGVASHSFGNIIAYRNEKFPQGMKDWADFWNVSKNPGSRSLQRYAARVLAMALLADGVSPDKLFPYDLDRAFKSLDRIKPHVRVWWTQGPQSQQLLRDGEVDAIGMWDTQATRLVEQKAPVTVCLNQARHRHRLLGGRKGHATRRECMALRVLRHPGASRSRASRSRTPTAR